METAAAILRSAKHFFAGTILSRFSGLFRDMAMAFFFGATPEIGAFMVAYRLASLLRRLFGEGNLQSGFVPHFESLRGDSVTAAFRFYRDSAYSLCIGLGAVVVGIEGIFWLSLHFLSPGWQEIVKLAMWMAPGLIFICLSALNGALLQCQKRYFAAAFAPVLFNGVWIVCALISHRFEIQDAVRFLSIGVTLAFAAQWLCTTFKVRKELRGFERVRPQLFSYEWKKMAAAMGLGILGIGAMQINSALDAIFARISNVAGPTYLWYAIRVQQLPLSLFGIAISSALLPPLARAVQMGDLENYGRLLSDITKRTAALIIPCFFALFALGAVGLNLLFGRGHFTPSDLTQTLICLWGYAIGLVPASFVLIFAVGSFAKKRYRIASVASLLSVGLNIMLNGIFVFALHLGPLSIALATSAGAWLNFFLLFPRKTIDGLGKYTAKLILAGAFAAVITMVSGYFLGAFSFPREFWQQIIQFFGMSSMYIISFLAVAPLSRDSVARFLGAVGDEFTN